MPQDQFSALELLLDDGSLDDPLKRKAMGAQLRKQNAMGVIGQLMGTQPTQMAGQNIQQSAQDSLKLAMSQRQAAKEAAAQASRQAVMDQRDARDFAQRAEGIEATRVNQAATRAGSGPIIDTPGGKVRVTPENTTTPIMDAEGKPVPATPKTPTENQSTLATYAARLEQNLPVVESLLDKGYAPSATDFGIVSLGDPRAYVMLSDEGKQYYGSAGQLVNAIMRRESGAAISATEWAMANSRWLVGPNDPPKVVAQKRANLRQELEQLKKQAGPAYTGMGNVEGGASPGAETAPQGVVWERGPDGRPRRKSQ